MHDFSFIYKLARKPCITSATLSTFCINCKVMISVRLCSGDCMQFSLTLPRDPCTNRSVCDRLSLGASLTCCSLVVSGVLVTVIAAALTEMVMIVMVRISFLGSKPPYKHVGCARVTADESNRLF